jgi:putative methyltransferase
VDPWDPQYAKVGYILVDPSCSGSGIVGRHNLQTDDNDNKIQKTNRLKRLSAFQLSLLLHAFQFPSVQRVCYSTCSIHVEENESVVKIALSLQKKFVLAPILPTWHRRGDEAVLGEDAKKVVRVSPVDGANGFFVALFQKK